MRLIAQNVFLAIISVMEVANYVSFLDVSPVTKMELNAKNVKTAIIYKMENADSVVIVLMAASFATEMGWLLLVIDVLLGTTPKITIRTLYLTHALHAISKDVRSALKTREMRPFA